MIYAVIDTNVLVASFLTRHEDAATLRVMRALGAGMFTLLYDDEILNEYREVLSRPRFKIAPAVVNALIGRIRDIGEAGDRIASASQFTDEDDRVFYEVALSRQNQGARLVTGNARHYPGNPLVVSPAQFCEILGI